MDFKSNKHAVLDFALWLHHHNVVPTVKDLWLFYDKTIDLKTLYSTYLKEIKQ